MQGNFMLSWRANRSSPIWIKGRIEKYGFTEGLDYSSFDNIVKRENGATVRKEYALSIDMAKELSMVENNDKGRQARKYFIECEKIARNKVLPSYQIEDPIERAKRWIVEQEEKKALEARNAAMQPKADYFDNLVEKGLLTNFRDTAKEATSLVHQVRYVFESSFRVSRTKICFRPNA